MNDYPLQQNSVIYETKLNAFNPFQMVLHARSIVNNCPTMFIPDVSCYRPQRSWAKVIFSQASVCPQGRGRGSASVHAGLYPPDPPDQTPPGPDPPEQTPPQTRPPGTRHPPRTRHPPGANPPRTRHPPGADTPPPGSRLQHTVNERPVRILLECILVESEFTLEHGSRKLVEYQSP